MATLKQFVLVTAWILFLCVALSGCGESDTKSKTDPSTPPATSSSNLDALRSLPYAAGSHVGENDESGVVLHDRDRSCPGYNLYSGFRLSMAELIDENGDVINRWSVSPNRTWWNCELQPNGDLLVVGRDASPTGVSATDPVADDPRYAMCLNWQGQVIWKQTLTTHHDIEQTPDGNLLVLTYQPRLIPQLHHKIKLRDDLLVRLEPGGTVIESMSIFEAINRNPEAFNPSQIVKPSVIGGSKWIDLFHANSVEWMHHRHLISKHPLYALDNVLVCMRHQDRIAVFNWTRGEVVWSWGHGEISGPHDAHVLDSGHILLFDNGLARQRSRAIELDPLSGQIVWQYDPDPSAGFYTIAGGAVQRLPNGNTLMTISDRGRAAEVTPDGEVVWEYYCPHEVAPGQRSSMVRMKRYPREYVQKIIEHHQHGS